MGRYCCVCRKNKVSHPELSFHRFPTETVKRTLWCEAVGFPADKVPKRAEICSSHFRDCDFQMKSSGIRFLINHAQPMPYYGEDSENDILKQITCKEEHRSTSGPLVEMQIYQEASTSKDLPTYEKRELAECENSDIVAGPSGLGVEQMYNVEVISSSSTLTASETEREIVHMLESAKDAKTILQEVIGPKSGFTGFLSSMEVPKKRKRRYVGDMSSGDFSSPTKAKKNFHLMKTKLETQRKKIKALRQKVTRLEVKVNNLNELMSMLTEKFSLTESSTLSIQASLTGSAGDILERIVKGKQEKYSPSLRSFALTLSFYSANAYEFVRNCFEKALPHPRTLSKWYRSVDGSPGFTEESFEALKRKQKQSSHQILCNLCLDEMSIRKQVEWTGTKFTGYIDIGTQLESEIIPEAREALCFMLVALNAAWKIPVGYFLIDAITSTEKAGLVLKCLEFIHGSGVLVTSITFDGAPTNFAMAGKLGADFKDVSNIKTSFKHPITDQDIFIFLDPCHMIKLVRNCFGSQKVLYDGLNDLPVEWNYITKLVEKQYSEGLHAGTKLKLRHLDWTREKMKVRLAVQTLSRSVSDALIYLSQQFPEFSNSTGTSHFLRLFNDLFDIFNSRNTFAKYKCKKPLSDKNADEFFTYLTHIEKYIKNIQLFGKPVLDGGRKTGFLGFLICINSLKQLYNKYVVETHMLHYLLTYKLSQDHLELFFGAVRSRGGFNNNPTARQFEAAYKRLIVHTELVGVKRGNVQELENIPILTYGSSLTTNEDGDCLYQSPDFLSKQREIISQMNQAFVDSNVWNLTSYIQDVVGYVAGFVVKILKKCVTCVKCLTLLEGEESLSLLQNVKEYGKLTKASTLVIHVCKEGEISFRMFTKISQLSGTLKNPILLLTTQTLHKLSSNVYDYFGDHLFEDDPVDGHAPNLIKLILKTYFNIRLHHEMSKKLDCTVKGRVRSMHTKTTLFKNQ